MKKIALFIMIFTLLSKVLGFLRDSTLSYYYGTSSVSDAYLSAVMIPQTIFTLLGAAIAAGFIPIYTGIEKRDGEIKANNLLKN